MQRKLSYVLVLPIYGSVEETSPTLVDHCEEEDAEGDEVDGSISRRASSSPPSSTSSHLSLSPAPSETEETSIAGGVSHYEPHFTGSSALFPPSL